MATAKKIKACVVLFTVLLSYAIIFQRRFTNKCRMNSLSAASFSYNFSRWSFILDGNRAQQKIKNEVIFETLRFMINETDEMDPDLINFVRGLINEPSQKQLNLKNMNRVHYSQYNESNLIDKMLNGKKNGFIVEAGAFDGETYSNSLFFEKERDFSGILIEPLPLSYERLLEKNRKFYSINACIAQKVPTVAKFKMFKAGALSGRSKSFKDPKNKPLNYEFIYVPYFSIQTILTAINVKTVDLFSLDVEGGEFDVLKSINFDKINIKSFVLEHKHSSKDQLKKILEEKNFKLFYEDTMNLFFLNKLNNF